MSNIDKYTKFIAEQVRMGSFAGLRSEAADSDIDHHLKKANTLHYKKYDGYSSNHEFTSPHDHETIVKKYRDHIKKSIPETGETHSRLTRRDTFAYKSGDKHETSFNSHNNNLERHGHNTVHYIETTKTKDGFHHTIRQRENHPDR